MLVRLLSLAGAGLKRLLTVGANPKGLAIIGAAVSIFSVWGWMGTNKRLDEAQERLANVQVELDRSRSAERDALERTRQIEGELNDFIRGETTDPFWSGTPIPESELDRMRDFYGDQVLPDP